MMIETAQAVNDAGADGIKIHLLQVLRNTPLEKKWREGVFTIPDRDACIAVVCDQLERLRPDLVIHRLTGDAPRELVAGPAWSLRKWEILNAVDAELLRRASYQGCKTGPRAVME
jgi:uncharacterized protein